MSIRSSLLLSVSLVVLTGCIGQLSSEPTPVECTPSSCADSQRTACDVKDGAIHCSCPEGTVEQGNACVAKNACDSNPCTGAFKSVCNDQNGVAVCSCDPGHAPEGDGCSATPIFDCTNHHAGDAFEPDECPASARDIGVLGEQDEAHTLGNVPGDSDWFQIRAAKGQIYRVETEGKWGSATAIDLFGTDGVTWIGGDSFGASVSTASFRATEDGTYFARIRAIHENTVGEYTVRIASEGADDFPSTSPDNELRSGVPAAGRIQFGGDVDAMKLELQGARTYSLKAQRTDGRGAPLRLELFNANGTKLLSTDERIDPKRLLWSAQSTQLQVRVSDPDAHRTGAWVLTLSSIGPDDHADDDAFAEQISPSPLQKSGNFDWAEDVDAFAANLQAGHIYRLNCVRSQPEQKCFAAIYDPEGMELLRDEYGDVGSIGILAETTGRYVIHVWGAMQPGGYHFTFDDEGADDHGNTPASATQVSVASTGTARIQYGNDQDVLKFDVGASEVVHFTCTASPELGGCVAELIDSNETLLARNNAEVFFKTSRPGTFFARVSSRDPWAIGGFTWSLEAAPEDYGDDIASPTLIAVGDVTQGRIDFDGDLDVFSFHAIAGHAYRASCTGDLQLGGCRVRFLNSAGGSLISGISRAGVEAKSTGPLFVEISAESGRGAYSWKLEDLGPDDVGDSISAATALQTDSGLGAIETNGDHDVFSFPVAAGRSYAFECTPDTLLGACALDIFDASGALLSTGSSMVKATATVNATWFAQVRADPSAMGRYKYRLSGDDASDQALLATVLSGAHPSVKGTLEVEGDADWFAMQLSPGTTSAVQLSSSGSAGALELEVWADGALVAKGAGPLQFTAGSSGLVRVKVQSASGTTTGEYSLSVP